MEKLTNRQIRRRRFKELHPEEYKIKNRLKSSKHRRKNLYKNKYGIDISKYDELFLKQEGKCAICNNTQNNKRLSVDHNHITKKVRGLLCFDCNTALGKFKDSKELLQKAILYLTE